MAPRPDIPRHPKLPSTGLSRPPRKKPGPKKRMPAALTSTMVAPSSTLVSPSSTPVSTVATNYGTEEDIHDAYSVFDGMPTSASTSFSNLLDESVAIDNIPLCQPFPSVDEESDEDVAIISPPIKKRGQRAANYSSDEDVALVMAWEFVSLDAIAGVDQSSTTYWSRISEHFHRNAKATTARTIGSLQHRWSTIQECCNKWKSCLTQVARQHPSGVPLQEQANIAQERYKAMDQQKHRPFTMFHCWTLLQYNQKWINKELECPPKRPRSIAAHEKDGEVDIAAHEKDGEKDEEAKGLQGGNNRPAGRKKEKERVRKEAYGSGCKEAIQEMIETKKRLAMDKDARWMDIKAIEERKEANEAKRLRLKAEKAMAKKKEEDQKIMFMDISALDDTQKAFVEAMRAKILAELLGGGGS
ncbi:unnamed protein product [Urochloa decumbens]|uniref:No apical meristem-associated C-terminal domain-containing protein n=1 Tax=Urochloa decumbens TaxID=240449 RepID=A0ABC9EXP0_9POAL